MQLCINICFTYINGTLCFLDTFMRIIVVFKVALENNEESSYTIT